MHKHIDFFRRHLEQIGGLNHLQRFVHERRAVDADFRAHVPDGMLACLLGRRNSHLLAGHRAERAARRRDNQLGYAFAMLGIEHLIDRVVLAVDRKEFAPVFCHKIHHQRTSAHQCFLVGKSEFYAALGRCNGGRQPCRANDGRHNPVAVHLRGFNDCTRPCRDLDVWQIGNGVFHLLIF